MAKLTYGPIVSDARGSTAGVTFSRWKQSSYGRRKTRPTNPNTVAQQGVRNVFQTLSNVWRMMQTNYRACWDFQASGRNYSGRNHFLGLNVPRLQGDANLADLLMSPGMAGTNAPNSLTLTPGVGVLTVACTSTTPPVGFTAVAALLGIIPDADPDPAAFPIMQESRDVSVPYSFQFTALPAGNYRGFACIEYTAPDGSTRYGPSVSALATVT